MCFGLEWIKDIVIWAIIIAGVIAFVKLILPRLGSLGAFIIAALDILIWVIVGVFVVIIFFKAIACLGGFSLFH